MNYQRQWLVGLMPDYAVDQRDTVDLLSIQKDMAVHAEATRITPNELEDLLSPRGAVMETPDELEDFLSAWESLPDQAFLIF